MDLSEDLQIEDNYAAVKHDVLDVDGLTLYVSVKVRRAAPDIRIRLGNLDIVQFDIREITLFPLIFVPQFISLLFCKIQDTCIPGLGRSYSQSVIRLPVDLLKFDIRIIQFIEIP